MTNQTDKLNTKFVELMAELECYVRRNLRMVTGKNAANIADEIDEISWQLRKLAEEWNELEEAEREKE